MTPTTAPTTDGLDRELVRRAPKLLLHDHLDGGLRPSTVRDLADAIGHELPAEGVDDLAAWFYQGGRGADLPRYLDAFGHTVALLQTREAIERVARECAEDLDLDGVVYAEVRYAPELSTVGGLELGEVLEAIAAGFDAGPSTITIRTLVCAMRQADRSEEVVEAAIAARHLGVVGIDLAGPEAGFPASAHAAAITRAREAGLHVTLHAGEADGPCSIADALDQGAERLGHGVRLIEDVDGDTLGPVARRVLAEDVTLEVCPTSNVHTGAATDLVSHPLARLRELGLRVTLNTDNRLMSGVTATDEALAVLEANGWGLDVLEELTHTAVAAAFVDADTRAELADQVARGFAALHP